MQILFLTHYFPPEVNSSSGRTFEHCSRWVEAGHDVTVITCTPNCPTGVVFDGYRNAWRTEETIAGIRVIRVWSWMSSSHSFAGRLLNYFTYMLTAVWAALWLRRVDVVVATSPQFFCGWAGVLCHWLRRWPFVLEVCEIWPESFVAERGLRRTLAIRLLEWLEHRMYAAAQLIVTVGDGCRDQLLRRNVPLAKLAVIPNGVDLDNFAPRERDPALRREWGGQGKFVCASVGTIGMAHGLEVVLEAAAKLKDQGRDDVHFWIVGDGAQRRLLEQEAATRGLTNVRFTGLVPKDRVDDVMAACDACLVHLRATELFATVIPSKVFEIMAMNVPIIMGVRGQAQEIVLHGAAGIPMTPGDADSLLAGISEIQKQRCRFTHGRDHVSQHFDRNHLAARMLHLLERHVSPVVTLPATQWAETGTARKAA